jgi:AcrR family transcriptional regulator
MSTEREGRGRGRRQHEEGNDQPIWTLPEPGARRAGHSRDEIARVALVIADEEGFEAVSMRSVARALGAGTMTLYHYVRNREDLLALMDDALMGELLVPEDEFPADDWRAALTAIAGRTRDVWRRHPWTLDAMRGARVGPNGLRHFEQSLAAVAGTGLPEEERMRVLAMVDDYTLGFSIRNAVLGSITDEVSWTTLMEYMEKQLETGEFPHLKELVGDDTVKETSDRMMGAIETSDGRFEEGLNRLLDGIAQEIEARAGAASSRPAARSARARGRSRGGGARR